jgi:hypothetical protein
MTPGVCGDLVALRMTSLRGFISPESEGEEIRHVALLHRLFCPTVGLLEFVCTQVRLQADSSWHASFYGYRAGVRTMHDRLAPGEQTQRGQPRAGHGSQMLTRKNPEYR